MERVGLVTVSSLYTAYPGRFVTPLRKPSLKIYPLCILKLSLEEIADSPLLISANGILIFTSFVPNNWVVGRERHFVLDPTLRQKLELLLHAYLNIVVQP